MTGARFARLAARPTVPAALRSPAPPRGVRVAGPAALGLLAVLLLSLPLAGAGSTAPPYRGWAATTTSTNSVACGHAALDGKAGFNLTTGVGATASSARARSCLHTAGSGSGSLLSETLVSLPLRPPAGAWTLTANLSLAFNASESVVAVRNCPFAPNATGYASYRCTATAEFGITVYPYVLDATTHVPTNGAGPGGLSAWAFSNATYLLNATSCLKFKCTYGNVTSGSVPGNTSRLAISGNWVFRGTANRNDTYRLILEVTDELDVQCLGFAPCHAHADLNAATGSNSYRLVSYRVA